jgi:hypothetical protein
MIVFSATEAPIFRSSMDGDGDPDLLPTTAVVAQGNIRIDVCLMCRLKVEEQAAQSVN